MILLSFEFALFSNNAQSGLIKFKDRTTIVPPGNFWVTLRSPVVQVWLGANPSAAVAVHIHD